MKKKKKTHGNDYAVVRTLSQLEIGAREWNEEMSLGDFQQGWPLGLACQPVVATRQLLSLMMRSVSDQE